MYGDCLTSRCSLSTAPTESRAALLPPHRKSSPCTTIVV